MRLLLVEDEHDLADALAGGLGREGYVVTIASDGQSALRAASEADVDLMILDRDLPGLSGDAVCRILRAEGHPVRILMLTAAASVEDRVTGLDLGADDYLAKPFAYLELLARVRALARRARSTGTVLDLAGVRVDTVRRLAEREGRPLHLARKELGVLECLLMARGGYVTSEELLEEVWEAGDERSRSVVKAAVHTLRRKLGAPGIITSSPRLGYRIEAEP